MTYLILDNGKGRTLAVKRGWSWPAFFLTWMWAFAKELYRDGILVLVLSFIVGFILGASPVVEGAKFLIFILYLFVIALIMGATGNETLAKSCEHAGFRRMGYVSSPNSFEALEEFDRMQSRSSSVGESSKAEEDTVFDRLRKLGELHTSGVLSDEEFAEMKKRLIEQSGLS